jgi:hypothetical protein
VWAGSHRLDELFNLCLAALGQCFNRIVTYVSHPAGNVHLLRMEG